MDYQSNSKKSKEGQDIPEKKIEKVIKGEVVVQKKSIGRKFRDAIIEMDLRNVVHYVVHDIFIPAAKNMIVDTAAKGAERMMYGESARHRRIHGVGSHITYNSPINRGYRDPRDYRGDPRLAPRPTIGPRSSRYDREDFIISTREEAEAVVERMNDIIDNYEIASVADLYELVGLPSNHVDHKWGWVSLLDVPIRQIREGYLIEFPPVEPIN